MRTLPGVLCVNKGNKINYYLKYICNRYAQYYIQSSTNVAFHNFIILQMYIYEYQGIIILRRNNDP